MHWEYLDNEYRKTLHDTYAKLLKLRNDYPELFDSSASLTWKVGESDWNNGRTLHLTSTTGKQLVVLGNFTNGETTITFPATTGSWNNWNTNEAQEVASTVKVPANSFVIYTNF